MLAKYFRIVSLQDPECLQRCLTRFKNHQEFSFFFGGGGVGGEGGSNEWKGALNKIKGGRSKMNGYVSTLSVTKKVTWLGPRPLQSFHSQELSSGCACSFTCLFSTTWSPYPLEHSQVPGLFQNSFSHFRHSLTWAENYLGEKEEQREAKGED